NLPVPPIGPQVAPRRWANLGISDLAQRPYGAGTLQMEQTLAVSDAFTRTLVRWESDGLDVYGFMNVPAGEGPFPVVIVTHGYVDPAIYNTLTYTTRYADALAREGFLVIHPNLRGYAPSDDGPNPIRTGFAVDLLDLIAILQRDGGQPGPLAQADGSRIGLWGHSMGGGISLRVLAVSAARDTMLGVENPTVDGAVLYGSMSGDEQRNHDQIFNVFSSGTRGNWEPDEAPAPAELRRINPIDNLGPMVTPISIHHGEFDEQVPLVWSEELCQILQDAAKPVECFTYDGQLHTFSGEGDATFIARTIDFYNRTLRVDTPAP
ncbi:MAG: alpha/beta hydrolase family protein, partial [Caldilineaceae bacterium]